MNAVTKLEQPDRLPQTESATILQVIERAACNPEVDIDKMERLMQMHERMLARQAQAEFASALSDMQSELPVIGERGGIKDRSGAVQSTYALWEDINAAIKPSLQKFGFALSFRTAFDGPLVTVTGVLSHRGGHTETTSVCLPADTSGSKNSVQAIGSSVSYGKRYAAGALLNLTSHGEDDDGKAGGSKAITDEQAATIRELIESTGSDKPKFLAYMKAESVEAIAAKDYNKAVTALKNKARAK